MLLWEPSEGLSPPQVLDPPPCVFGPGGPLLPLGSIVDVLQYTQKDMDAAVRARRGVHGLLRPTALSTSFPWVAAGRTGHVHLRAPQPKDLELLYFCLFTR